jgi:hypothetical protein
MISAVICEIVIRNPASLKSYSIVVESSRRAVTVRAIYPGIEAVNRVLRSCLLLKEDFCCSKSLINFYLSESVDRMLGSLRV